MILLLLRIISNNKILLYLFGNQKNKNKSLQQKIITLLKRRKMFVFKSLPQSNPSVGTGVALLRGLTQS